MEILSVRIFSSQKKSTMCQTFIRLFFISIVFVLSTASENYQPKIFLYSEVDVEKINIEVFWLLANSTNSSVKLIRYDSEKDIICSNETISNNKIHAGRVLVIVFKQQSNCDLAPDIPVLQWYTEDDENVENDDDDSTLIEFNEGMITTETKGKLEQQIVKAVGRARQNKEKYDNAQKETKKSSSIIGMALIGALVLFLIIVLIIVLCRRKRQRAAVTVVEEKKDKEGKDATAKAAAPEKKPKEGKEKKEETKEEKKGKDSKSKKLTTASTESSTIEHSWKNAATGLPSTPLRPSTLSLESIESLDIDGPPAAPAASAAAATLAIKSPALVTATSTTPEKRNPFAAKMRTDVFSDSVTIKESMSAEIEPNRLKRKIIKEEVEEIAPSKRAIALTTVKQEADDDVIWIPNDKDVNVADKTEHRLSAASDILRQNEEPHPQSSNTIRPMQPQQQRGRTLQQVQEEWQKRSQQPITQLCPLHYQRLQNFRSPQPVFVQQPPVQQPQQLLMTNGNSCQVYHRVPDVVYHRISTITITAPPSFFIPSLMDMNF